MFKKISAAFAALLVSVSALSAPVFQGTLTGPNSSFAWTGVGVVDVFWNFVLPNTSAVGSSITNIELQIGPNLFNHIGSFAANIDGIGFASQLTPVPGGTVTTLFYTGLLAPGIHSLDVTGNAGTGASFGGNFVAVPVNKVPEPGILMLLGIGALALVTTRRRKQT